MTICYTETIGTVLRPDVYQQPSYTYISDSAHITCITQVVARDCSQHCDELKTTCM